MIEDPELLRRFAEEKSEDAFAELVRRRVDLVYSVALRQVNGDAHLAQDVTQRVFVDLARKAPTLLGRPVLAGWLCRSAQFAASDAVRAEQRRRRREQESQKMEADAWSPEDEADWNRVRPLLDEALGELNEQDRDAVALRFFEGRQFADIGRRLRLTEEAARKRVDRALTKLESALARRGVTSTSAALGLALAGHASVAAPAGLAASVTAASLAAGLGSAVGATITLGAKLAGAALAVAAALSTGVAVYQARENRLAQAIAVESRQEQEALRVQLRGVQDRLAFMEQQARAAEDDNARLLGAIEQTRGASSGTIITSGDYSREAVEARHRRAQEHMRAGRFAAALTDFLWCYDEGMDRNRGFAGTRLTVLLREIAALGRDYPPARVALRERRDQAERDILANSADESAAHEFASLNRALGEDNRTLELYDMVPAEDARRKQLVRAGVFQQLVGARRYADALQAVPYERLVPWFERETRPPDAAGEATSEAAAKRHRRELAEEAALAVEVLAGVGDLAHARDFAARLLAFDNSADTRDLLREHATRAGHPELAR